jgi:hypothetical protein
MAGAAATARATQAEAGNSSGRARVAAPPSPIATTVAPPFDAGAVAQLQACRQGEVVPYAPLAGPGVWRASDFPDPSSWTVELTPGHISELEVAVRGVLSSGRVVPRGNDLEGVSGGAPDWARGVPRTGAPLRRGSARLRARARMPPLP